MLEAEFTPNHSLGKKALKGVIFLGLRRVVFQVILTGANIILARILFPESFGAFAIALGFVNFFGLFASFGFETALIQKKENLEEKELQSVFTVTLILSILAVFLIFIITPFFLSFYQNQLGDNGILALRLLSISLIFFSLRSVSLSLLEKKLDYFKLFLAETLEILVLEILTIYLALRGYGFLSFVWGTLVSRLFGSVFFFILQPWPLKLSLSIVSVRSLFSFSFNFQSANIVTGFTNTFNPLFLGRIGGASSVGYFNWGVGLACLPRAIPDILARLIFPVCSHSQENKKVLKTIIERSIQLSSFAAFPLITLLIVLARPITTIIYTDKWLPGLSVLYFFSLQSIFLIIGTILMQVLLALGEAKAYRNITFGYNISLWLLGVPLTIIFGFSGLAASYALVSLIYLLPLFILKKRVSFNTGVHIWPYILFSSIIGLVAVSINKLFPPKNMVELLVIIIISLFLYLSLTLIFKRNELREDFLKLKNYLK